LGGSAFCASLALLLLLLLLGLIVIIIMYFWAASVVSTAFMRTEHALQLLQPL
jgi:hypothetical protein